jgi:SpoIIAA-like
MIELTSHGNIVCIRAISKLTVADYRDVLAPRIESLLNEFQSLKVLFVIDKTFDGWSLPAAWANTAFDWKHRRDFAKIAIVGAPKWEELCVKIAAKLLMSGQMRTLDRDQLADAWEWLRE